MIQERDITKARQKLKDKNIIFLKIFQKSLKFKEKQKSRFERSGFFVFNFQTVHSRKVVCTACELTEKAVINAEYKDCTE